MRLSKIFIVLFILLPVLAQTQKFEGFNQRDMEADTDIIFSDSDGNIVSATSWTNGLDKDSEIYFCPPGIERMSENDVRKRHAFRWRVKYKNIYVKAFGGVTVEGMNEHGFSASLMFLKNSRLADKEKELIPIGTSIVVNFFIDHFKCIDTALLAVWDIRIFDDLEGKADWPFRLVLHDSTGSTAYIEYIDGKKRVYTPELPASIVSGPDYAHLLTIKYITDSLPKTKAEKRFIQVSDSLDIAGGDYIRKNTFALFNVLEKISDNGFIIFREHGPQPRIWHIIFNKQHVRDPLYFLDAQNYSEGKEEKIMFY